MALEHERVQIWNQLVTSFDRVTNKWRRLVVHPWLNDSTDGVVVCVCFEAVDGKSGRVDPELDPTEQKFWAWLRPFETADVVAITLSRLVNVKV